MRPILVFLAVLVMLAACGGGGGDQSEAQNIAPLAQPFPGHVTGR